MNALEIAQLVRQECGIAGSGTPAAFTGQIGEMKRVVDWVIQADLYIQSLQTDWKFLWKEHSVPTEIGVAAYAVPTDFDEWDRDSFYLDYHLNTGNKLKYTDYLEWRSKYRSGVKTNSTPNRVIILPDNSLILDPPPAAVQQITADYYRTPIALAANDDVPPYPARYHRIIVARAKRMYAAYEDAPEILTEAENEFSEILPRLEASQLMGQENRYGDSNNAQMVVEVE